MNFRNELTHVSMHVMYRFSAYNFTPIISLSLHQVRISRQLVHAQRQQVLEAQRENSEIREMMQGLVDAFIEYTRNPSRFSQNSTFQAVVREIGEVWLSFVIHISFQHP